MGERASVKQPASPDRRRGDSKANPPLPAGGGEGGELTKEKSKSGTADARWSAAEKNGGGLSGDYSACGTGTVRDSRSRTNIPRAAERRRALGCKRWGILREGR